MKRISILTLILTGSLLGSLLVGGLVSWFMGQASTPQLNNSSENAVAPQATQEVVLSRPVIYVTVFTHNEDGLGPLDPDYTQDEDEFWHDREAVIDFAHMLKEHGAKYDFQSDWNFLLAVEAFDHGTDTSEGKNILRYLSEDLDVQIDPHSHQSLGYNLADVAYLISALGVTPSNIVGGMIASPPEESLLETFWKPIKANKADYTWTAEAIWGGGTGLHQDEELLWISGVWKPKNNEQFLTHDANAPLPAIGHFRSTWEGLDQLVELSLLGELEADNIYTISINAHQRELDAEFIEAFERKLLTYQDKVDEGLIVFATLDEVLRVWRDSYGEKPNSLLFQEPMTETTQEDSAAQCGDGTCSIFERKKDVCSEDCD